MFFDTHCHLNFKAYRKILDEVIADATAQGISEILIPGTDVPTSRRAIEIANEHKGYYVAAGIHPHHVFEMYAKLAEDTENTDLIISEQLLEIEQMMKEPVVVAVGELGIDRHMYVNTKYKEYTVTDDFVEMQKRIMLSQMAMVEKYKKTLIVHNREASKDLLNMFAEHWSDYFKKRMVFHCCEASQELLDFAKAKHIFIGIDGDITYGPEKKEFIAKVPKELLVLETDGPYLLPDPLRQEKKYPNKPANVKIIAQAVAEVWGTNIEEVAKITTRNAHELFHLQ
jgi:TatD DNase family protein